MNIGGIITALATPFNEQGELQIEDLKKLLRFQVKEQVDGLVINGTTGESPCLLQSEVEQIFKTAREVVGSKLPLILGVGTNSTQRTLENIRWAKALKPDALLVVVPYYNKPPQRGLVKHFKILADQEQILLYNVPARTGVGLSLDSILELSSHPNIIGIKEATGDLELAKQIIKRRVRPNFQVFSGDDDTCVEFFGLGGDGVISVISHIIARPLKLFFKQSKKAGGERALKEYKSKYSGLLKSVYSESNPIGIKRALELMGIFSSSELRAPLSCLAKEETKVLKQELEKLKLL